MPKLLRLGRTISSRTRMVIVVLLCTSLLLLMHFQNSRPIQIYDTTVLRLSRHHTELPSNSASLGLNQDHNKPLSKNSTVVDMSSLVSLLKSSNITGDGRWLRFWITRVMKIPKPVVVYTHDVYVNGFQFAHPELCPSLGKHLRLMVLVTSDPSHAAARDKVRQTWGHDMSLHDVAVAFVLGEPPSNLKPSIETENRQHGDIIMGRYIDSYSNLTLKTLSMLEWMDSYCPHAPYLLKTDDDVLINVDRLMNFMSAVEYINATRSIWGRIWSNSKPIRDMTHKYHVTPTQFPDEVFPQYTSGSGYVMSTDCVRSLLERAPSERYLRLEDVFVTGVLASQCNIQRIDVIETFSKIISL